MRQSLPCTPLQDIKRDPLLAEHWRHACSKPLERSKKLDIGFQIDLLRESELMCWRPYGSFLTASVVRCDLPLSSPNASEASLERCWGSVLLRDRSSVTWRRTLSTQGVSYCVIMSLGLVKKSDEEHFVVLPRNTLLFVRHVFDVLLTVHFSITLVNDQLDAQFFYFIIRLLQSSTCFEQRRAHHQEVSLY